MPLLSRLAVRASLLYLAAGACVGGVLLVDKGYPALVTGAGWSGLHREVLLMGWLLQLALGVAYWILPRRGGRRPRPRMAVVGLGLLNVGIAAVAAGELSGPSFLLPLGRGMELVAALLFTLHAWPRIRTTLTEGS